MAFINPVEANKDHEKYFETISPDDGSSDYRLAKNVFKAFLKEEQPCQANAELPDDGVIKGVHIWIRSDLDKNFMRRCVAEEFYNSFGLDEGVEVTSIFDYNYARTPGDYSLSDFDLLKLKILYRDEFKPGMAKTRTRKTAEQLISIDCDTFK